MTNTQCVNVLPNKKNKQTNIAIMIPDARWGHNTKYSRAAKDGHPH